MGRKFGKPYRSVEAGPPPKPKIHEESLSEPQLIKQTWIDIYFEACKQLAEINSLKDRGVKKPKIEADFKKNISSLFLMMAMKKPLKEQKGYKDFREDILKGNAVKFEELTKWLMLLGDALQELGPLKIEFLKSVDPDFAYMEDELIGDD
jgi:hypothetical protein